MWFGNFTDGLEKNWATRIWLGLDRFLPQSPEDNRGVKIVRGSSGINRAFVDVIMFHHSFEHSSPIRSVFCALPRVLQSPAGRCLIRVPVPWMGVAALWCSFGHSWMRRPIRAPTAIKSFRLLAAAAGSGVVDVGYDSKRVSVLGEQAVLTRH